MMATMIGDIEAPFSRLSISMLGWAVAWKIKI
jgi:hypothetical protein